MKDNWEQKKITVTPEGWDETMIELGIKFNEYMTLNLYGVSKLWISEDIESGEVNIEIDEVPLNVAYALRDFLNYALPRDKSTGE